jgi:hypothetical protein
LLCRFCQSKNLTHFNRLQNCIQPANKVSLQKEEIAGLVILPGNHTILM